LNFQIAREHKNISLVLLLLKGPTESLAHTDENCQIKKPALNVVMQGQHERTGSFQEGLRRIPTGNGSLSERIKPEPFPVEELCFGATTNTMLEVDNSKGVVVGFLRVFSHGQLLEMKPDLAFQINAPVKVISGASWVVHVSVNPATLGVVPVRLLQCTDMGIKRPAVVVPKLEIIVVLPVVFMVVVPCLLGIPEEISPPLGAIIVCPKILPHRLLQIRSLLLHDLPDPTNILEDGINEEHGLAVLAGGLKVVIGVLRQGILDTEVQDSLEKDPRLVSFEVSIIELFHRGEGNHLGNLVPEGNGRAIAKSCVVRQSKSLPVRRKILIGPSGWSWTLLLLLGVWVAHGQT